MTGASAEIGSTLAAALSAAAVVSAGAAEAAGAEEEASLEPQPVSVRDTVAASMPDKS